MQIIQAIAAAPHRRRPRSAPRPAWSANDSVYDRAAHAAMLEAHARKPERVIALAFGAAAIVTLLMGVFS